MILVVFCYLLIIAEMVSEHRLHGNVSILLSTFFSILASFTLFFGLKKELIN